MAKIEGFTGKVELGGLCGKDRGLYDKCCSAVEQFKP